MICLEKKLIAQELEYDRRKNFDFHYQKLSNKYIDWLFNHYYIEELCENFYDSEPNFDDEEYRMYMDYRDNYKLTGNSFWNMIINLEEIEKQGNGFRYSKESHTKEELKAAYDKVRQMYKDYEKRRIEFCNWQEPHFKGNWGATQKSVDKFGRRILKRIRKFPHSIKDRLYVAQKDDLILIYFYGRDLWQVDYWFIFNKRKRRKQ
jgi:hypothetical protein